MSEINSSDLSKLQTSKLSSDEFSTFLDASEHIESNTLKKQKTSTSVKTGEEWFDISSMDGDAFLYALEHDVSYKPKNLSTSMNNILQYFEEDVTVDVASDVEAKQTPMKPIRVSMVHSTPVVLPKIKEKVDKKPLGPKVKRIAEMFNEKIKQIAINHNFMSLKRKSCDYKRMKPEETQAKPKALHNKCQAPTIPSLPSQESEEDNPLAGLSVKEKINLFDSLLETKTSPSVPKVSSNTHEPNKLFGNATCDNVANIPPANKRVFSEVGSGLHFELFAPSQKVRKIKSEPKPKENEASTKKDEFVFLKPIPPPKKKKTKRTLKWKDEESIVEKATVTATDSESDSNSCNVLPKLTSAPPTPTPILQRKARPSDLSEAVDAQQLIRKLNEVHAESKVKDAYTLTAMSTPSPRLSMSASKVGRLPSLSESTTETEWESLPPSPARFSIGNTSPLFIKLPDSAFKHSNSSSRRSSLRGSVTPASTRRMSSCGDSRRSSVYDSNSRRNSMNMNVIFEEIRNIEQNMQTIKSQVRGIGRSSISPSDSSSGRMSSFWISYGSFRMALDIQFNSQSRLQKCYDIFSEKSADAAKLTFGIDNMKFAFDAAESHADVSKQLSKHRKCSHFWFLADDLIMPFTGPHVAKERITKIFEFLRSSVDNKSELKFGIDNVEFSKRPDAFKYDQKLSLDSNYSMLIGLNGKLSLDGRSKFSWPNTPLKTSDLGSDGFESEYNGSPLMLSPFERTYNYNENNRNSISSFSSFEGVDLIGSEYEQDPVEKTFHAQMNRLPRFA